MAVCITLMKIFDDQQLVYHHKEKTLKTNNPHAVGGS